MARLVVLCAALLLTLPAAAQAAGPAAPAEVVRRFAAELNAPYERARPCTWLSARVRPLVDSPEVAGADLRRLDSHSRAARRRGCERFVSMFQRHTEDLCCGHRWLRSAIGSARTIARHGRALHVRVALVERFTGRPPRRSSADVFLLREHGRWRIVSPGRLWRWRLTGPLPTFSASPPRTFAELPRYLRWLRRAGRRAREIERSFVRAILRARTRIATTPLSLPVRGSVADDPLRDVLGPFGRRLRDQDRSAVDLRGAALSTAGGRIAFALRFRGSVPRSATVELQLLQLQRWSEQADLALVERQWSVLLDDGWASAWDGDEGPAPIPGLRASVAGDTLLLLGGDGTGRSIDLARSLTWSASAYERAPDEETRIWWRDVLPNRSDAENGSGIYHPAPPVG